MRRYLGETKNPEQYRQLLREKLEENGNNQIEIFKIENKEGTFNAFPAKLEGQEGFIYSINQFDTYEFCTEDELLKKELKESVVIENSKKLNIQEAQEGIYSARDNKTKKIEEHQISFYDFKGLKQTKQAKKAVLEEQEGFIYQNQEWNGFRERNVNVNYFIKKEGIYSNKLTAKPKIYTQKELKEIEKEKLKEEYELTKKIFKERNIEIDNYPSFDNYERNGRYRISTVINKLKSLEKDYGLKVENKKINFEQLDKDLTEMLSIKKVEEASKDMLKSYGFTIKPELINDEVSITLLDKNNKKLSQLKTNNFTYEYNHEINITDKWDNVVDTETVEVSYGFVDLQNIMDSDDKEIIILENNKVKTIENSKYASLYEIFDKIAFTNDENLVEETDFENEEAVFLEVQDIEFDNQLKLINFVKKEIESNPKLKEELEVLNKQSNKRTQKI